jgi:fatty-acid peroxygenase
VRRVLFGAGTVHGLDDAEHHHRKAFFVRLLTRQAVAELEEAAEREWTARTASWLQRDPVVLFDEAVLALAGVVLPWAGIPVEEDELPTRARQLADVVDGFATPGPAYGRAVVSRAQLDAWCRRLVRRVRAGELLPPPGSALAEAAALTDRRGRPVPERVAATELLNVVRPTVAVAWFIAFAAVDLARHPDWRRRIAAGDRAAADAVTQEIRRLHPFVPVLMARTRREQDVLGQQVPPGGFVVLDVHGTDHDPEQWRDPDRFDPDRFLTGAVDPDALVPQGGGDVATGHRCPGEAVTLSMLRVAVRALAGVSYELPPQDLSVDLSRMPTRPRSGVVITVRG